MLLAVQIVFCGVLVVAGAALLFVGWCGLRGRLRPNRYAGVRTAATLRSEEAFKIGNRAASPALLAAGGVGVFSGAALPLLPSISSVVLVAVLGAIGTFVLMAVGGIAGHRAAEAVPEPGGCTGCAGACALGCG